MGIVEVIICVMVVSVFVALIMAQADTKVMKKIQKKKRLK